MHLLICSSSHILYQDFDFVELLCDLRDWLTRYTGPFPVEISCETELNSVVEGIGSLRHSDLSQFLVFLRTLESVGKGVRRIPFFSPNLRSIY